MDEGVARILIKSKHQKSPLARSGSVQITFPKNHANGALIRTRPPRSIGVEIARPVSRYSRSPHVCCNVLCRSRPMQHKALEPEACGIPKNCQTS